MHVKVTDSLPIKVKVKPMQGLPSINYDVFFRNKVIKNYVYMPEYRVIGI